MSEELEIFKKNFYTERLIGVLKRWIFYSAHLLKNI